MTESEKGREIVTESEKGREIVTERERRMRENCKKTKMNNILRLF